MKEKQLLQAIGEVDEELIEEARTARRHRPPVRVIVTRLGALAACLALVVGLGVSRLSPAVPQLLPEPTIQRSDGIMVLNSPMGMRKFLNYNGCRYVFMGDGIPYDLSGFALDAHLGTLEYDIVAGLEAGDGGEIAMRDLAATFAVGGELYAIPGYNPTFRMAVVQDGSTYLAQLVGNVDDTPLDADYYFTVSGARSLVERIDILPHMGGEPVRSIGKKKEMMEVIRLLSEAIPAPLSGREYEAVAGAQAGGQSWQLVLRLSDGTDLSMYIIPALALVSIGDSTYTLPDAFLQEYAVLFDGLSQDSPPYYQ